MLIFKFVLCYFPEHDVTIGYICCNCFCGF